MQKRGYILPLLSVLFLNFVSAQFFSGYNRFSLQDFLNRTDPQSVTLVLLFLGFFIVIFTIFKRLRFFKDAYGETNNTASGILSLVISAGITYWLYIRGFDLSGFFFDIGLSTDSLYAIFPILILIATIIFIWKTSLRMFLMVAGILLLLLTLLTDVFYAKGFVTIVSLALITVGGWLFFKKKLKLGKPKLRNFGEGGYIGDSSQLDEIRRRKDIERAHKEALRVDKKRGEKQTRVSQKKLRKEYQALMQENHKLFKKNGGIPPRGTQDGERRSNNLQRMMQIESIFKQQGWRL